MGSRKIGAFVEEVLREERRKGTVESDEIDDIEEIDEPTLIHRVRSKNILSNILATKG